MGMHTVSPIRFTPLPLRLVGKRALVTGAGSEIGRSAAIRLAQEGARVGLVGRRAGILEETAGVIGNDGGECLVLPCDVSKEDQVAQAVSAAAEAWGGLDVLVAVGGSSCGVRAMPGYTSLNSRPGNRSLTSI